jgi:hypothetical protein
VEKKSFLLVYDVNDDYEIVHHHLDDDDYLLLDDVV